MEIFQLGEWITLCLMAFALGMDAFSVCIAVGMQGIRLLHVAKISLVNGVFHMIMPLIGILLGRSLSTILGNFTIFLGGGLLVFFGLHMIYHALFKQEKMTWLGQTNWGLVLFALGVSVDSFSVGLTLGLFAIHIWLAVCLFGLFGMLLTMLGLLLGRKVGSWAGGYGQIFGGIILVVLGIKFLL